MTMTAEEVLANGNTNLIYTYPGMTKTMRSKTGKEFKLHVKEGQFADSEILVLLGTDTDTDTDTRAFVRGFVEAFFLFRCWFVATRVLPSFFENEKSGN